MKRDPVVLIVVAMVVALMLVFGFKLARRSSQPFVTSQMRTVPSLLAEAAVLPSGAKATDMTASLWPSK